MGELLKKGLNFVRENPRIIYSLFLVFVIPLAISFNTYYVVDRFEKNLDTIIQSKAVLAENLINLVARDAVGKNEDLENLVREIKKGNDEIEYFKIFSFDKEKEIFTTLASTESGEISQQASPTQQVQNLLAWNQPQGIALLDSNDRGRFWNVTKAVKGGNGEKLALVSLSFSLADSDKLVNQTINYSYLILIVTILIVLLLVANNARLFGYALTLTKLKEIDKMKDTFISMASHELKAPLISMKGNVEFLEEDFAPHLNEQGKHYIENIGNSVERLEMLVGDILEVSRLEGNRIPINISEVEASQIIEKSVEEVKPQAVRKGLALNYAPVNLPRIKTDSDRAKQIIINLISNAVKYTVQGKVEILTEVKDKNLLVTVADTGVGISSEDQAKLFQKFSRVYNEETKMVSGTGLGLWISRELARKMGGDITVESIRGVGSHFTLRLPLA
jgi:signal transduction histidine kinase